jgi:hypothetical protein
MVSGIRGEVRTVLRLLAKRAHKRERYLRQPRVGCRLRSTLWSASVYKDDSASILVGAGRHHSREEQVLSERIER